jgi:hypothetical protein
VTVQVAWVACNITGHIPGEKEQNTFKSAVFKAFLGLITARFFPGDDTAGAVPLSSSPEQCRFIMNQLIHLTSTVFAIQKNKRLTHFLPMVRTQPDESN